MNPEKSDFIVKISNTQPVDLLSLGLSFAAFSDEFSSFIDAAPDGTRLYVKELRVGSIIADLVALSEQIDWLRKQGEVYAAFALNFNELINFFLGLAHNLKENPTYTQAKNLSEIVDPIAKDSGSQMNLIVNGSTVNIHLDSIGANALQNNVARYVGAQSFPSTQIFNDQLMQLEQVKNDARRKGDRGIITEISDKPVKLYFACEEAKQAVLGIEDNPFKCLFLVDVEVKFHEGKPKIYKIYSVKEIVRD